VKRTSLFLSEPQLRAFQKLARRQDRPAAELIREALDEYLRNRIGLDTKKSERPRATTRERS
jgi:predicted DNA-binding protein